MLELDRQQFTLAHGDHKVFASTDREALEAGEVLFAYDLAADPGENEAVQAPWIEELCRLGAASLDEHLTPELDAHAHTRYRRMKELYRIEERIRPPLDLHESSLD